MKKSHYLFLVITLLLASCSNSSEQQQTRIKPVKVATVQPMSMVSKNYAGIVTSGQTTTMAFKVSGQIIETNVSSGDIVKKGDYLAAIDTRDYDLENEVNKSEYITAKAQYERFKRLIERGAVSQQDYEIAETNYKRAEAAFNNSQNMLKDTRLYAPFDATVENVYVDEYQEVTSGEPIVKLVDTEVFYIEFNLADYSLDKLRIGKPEFFVRFGNIDTTYYKARIREYTDISTDGTGIPVSVWIDDPRFDKVIKPGFSCDVKVNFHFDEYDNKLIVPITAVFVDFQTGKTCVKIVSDGTVKTRPVKVVQLEGKDFVAITEGLQAGEKVVSAGAVTLQDGEHIKIIN